MRKISILLILLFAFTIFSFEEAESKPRKKGITTRIKDAAANGYGFQLGKEGAKETVKGVKEFSNSEKGKKFKNDVKEKGKSIIKKFKKDPK